MMPLIRYAPSYRALWVCGWLISLTGCQLMAPRVDLVQPASPLPLATTQVVAPTGSLYNPTTYRPLFQDHRASQVGDLITVLITEKVSATQKSTSSIDKTGKATSSITGVPILGNQGLIGKLGGGGSSNTNFSGESDTQASNSISGTITATVIEVLPNGHLIIAGEKQLGVNENVDILKFSGQVDPITIQSGNTVISTAIANVRLQHRGRGAAAEAQGIGWLGRFFLNVMPF